MNKTQAKEDVFAKIYWEEGQHDDLYYGEVPKVEGYHFKKTPAEVWCSLNKVIAKAHPHLKLRRKFVLTRTYLPEVVTCTYLIPKK